MGTKDERDVPRQRGAVTESFLGPGAGTVDRDDESETMDDEVTFGANDAGGDAGGDGGDGGGDGGTGKGSRSGMEDGEKA